MLIRKSAFQLIILLLCAVSLYAQPDAQTKLLVPAGQTKWNGTFEEYELLAEIHGGEISVRDSYVLKDSIPDCSLFVAKRMEEPYLIAVSKIESRKYGDLLQVNDSQIQNNFTTPLHSITLVFLRNKIFRLQAYKAFVVNERLYTIFKAGLDFSNLYPDSRLSSILVEINKVASSPTISSGGTSFSGHIGFNIVDFLFVFKKNLFINFEKSLKKYFIRVY